MRKLIFAGLVVLGSAACTSSAPESSQPAPGATVTSSPAFVSTAPAPGATVTSSPTYATTPPAPVPPADGLTHVHDPGAVTGTITGSCHFTGIPPSQRPDPRCTPGSYDPAMTAAKICASGYSTRSYRAPASGPHGTTRFKYDVAYPAYGVSPSARTELDHLVSLELGGSNDATNLWPESPPTPNQKDAVENTLHAWVCSARGLESARRLHLAQQAIALNWVTAEQLLGVPSGA